MTRISLPAIVAGVRDGACEDIVWRSETSVPSGPYCTEFKLRDVTKYSSDGEACFGPNAPCDATIGTVTHSTGIL